jgi:hypothetical protein
MSYLTDPWVLTALIGGGIFIVSYLLGKSAGEGDREQTIENTIIYLINERYVKAKRDREGAWELLKFDEEFD